MEIEPLPELVWKVLAIIFPVGTEIEAQFLYTLFHTCRAFRLWIPQRKAFNRWQNPNVCSSCRGDVPQHYRMCHFYVNPTGPPKGLRAFLYHNPQVLLLKEYQNYFKDQFIKKKKLFAREIHNHIIWEIVFSCKKTSESINLMLLCTEEPRDSNSPCYRTYWEITQERAKCNSEWRELFSLDMPAIRATLKRWIQEGKRKRSVSPRRKR